MHLARCRLPAGVTASRREERADGQPEQARPERPTEDTNVAVRFRSRRAGCTAPTRHCRSAPASEAGGSTLRVEPAPALPKSATGELVAADTNKKILTIQIRPAKVITGLARKHSDSVSASSNHFSSALLNHANRSRRAPPQPFRGQAREKFLRASSQVFCESYPRNQPAVLVLPADQTPDHASRISAMEGQQ